MNVIPDIFKDGGAELSSVKYTCAGGGIFAADAGYGSVSDAAGDGTGDGIFSAAAAGYGCVAPSDAWGGVVASDSGDGSSVGCTGVYGGLGTAAYGALPL